MARLLAGVAPLVAVSAATSASEAVTPIQKVVDLLQDMVAKGEQDKHEEEVEFAKFQSWCDSTRQVATRSITEGKGQIEQLSADIAKAEADAADLAADVQELEASVAKAEGELKGASAIREKEHADYTAMHTDYSESVDAIERAIAVLKARSADVPQSLLQVQKVPHIPEEAKAIIDSFLATSGGLAGAPEANAYEFQSGGVVAMLEKLRIKFQDQRTGLEKEELNARHNFEMLAQKLTDDLKENNKIASKKTATKAQRVADAATFKGDLSATEKAKSQDEKTLSDTLVACHSRSEEYEKNQVVRAEEVKAIRQAVGILASEEVSGAADQHLPKLAQVATALVQLRGGGDESPQEARRRERLVQLLQGAARQSGSPYLALVASHASADPFTKVKKMIKDLIVKLMEQANSEADHKAYCDTELATNKQTREIKTNEVDELSASLEKNTASSAELAQEITEASDAVAELRKQQADATKMRHTEKATNAKTVEEAKAAQVAVERATKILKEFYGSVADANLLQGSNGLGQEMSNAVQAPYQGMQSKSGGVLGILEVILSDFARLESETTSAEDQAASAFEKFMDESSQDIAVKEAEVSHKTGSKQQTDAKIASIKKELQLTQKELDATLEYYEKLKPDCVDHKLSYSDRVQMREEEIQSLKEALQILNQQDLD